MRCSSTIAATSACLGIMPGVACPSPCAPAPDLLDGIPSCAPGVLRRPASNLEQHDEKILTFAPVESVQDPLQISPTFACSSAIADPRLSGDQHERR